MSEAERRKYKRHPCALQVALQGAGKISELTTANVSHHGAFVITDSPPDQRSLIKLSFHVPGGELVDVMAMVAHHTSLPGENGDLPGMGVDFFAMSGEARSRWEGFVSRLATDPGFAAELAKPRKKVATQRRHMRRVACFLVQVKEKEALDAFYTRDISLGGMFLTMPEPQAVRKFLELILVHPETSEEFHLTGQVMRIHEQGPVEEHGLAVKFDELPPSRLAALLTFVESGYNHLEPVAQAQQERIEQLNAARELVCESPKALVAVGEEMLRTNVEEELLRTIQYDLACRVFRHALSLDPDHVAAHRGLADVLVLRGDLEQADFHRREAEKLKRE